ncbi:hypothetical protein HK104_005826 [Borealophlyctis nickersoniae]|nr:hypothetical protein HK104_005826 [Borealophlyctis nickersoniae]
MGKDLVLNLLAEYKALADANAALEEFEVDIQSVDGSHRFDMMHETVIKAYSNVTNVVARLSCGPTCNQNAILLNSHYDSTIVSPGAADDGAGVAVMLEMVRILSMRKRPLKNAVIFLWNGAEESLNDAAHGFITKHKWKDTVRAVLNMEAMGNGGQEILFQANSKEMIEAYSRVPHPHGNVLSNDIFRSGLILSETDYRQFVQHGKVAALDMAYYQNSYLYHTMLDVEETLQKGSLQHFGDNAWSILEYLLTESDLANIDRDSDIIFFDLFGLIFFHYSWDTAVLIHTVIMLISFTLCSIPILARFGRGSSTDVYRAAVNAVKFGVIVIVSTMLSIVTPTLVGAAFMAINRPLTWFAREWYIFVAFAPASAFGMLLLQQVLKSDARSIVQKASAVAKKDGPDVWGSSATDPEAERNAYNAVQFLFTILLFLANWFRLGSSYLVGIYLSFIVLGNIIDLLFTPQSKRNVEHMPWLTYVAALVPVAASTSLSWGVSYLFVPITGRMGATAPADIIVGVIAGGLTFLLLHLIMPLGYRISKAELREIKKIVGAIVIVMFVFFAAKMEPFDETHPKRVFFEYKENKTSGTRELMVAHADPAGMPRVLQLVEAVISSPVFQRDVAETDRDWATIFPFSHFIESYSFDVSHLAPPKPAQAPAPFLTVQDDSYSPTTDLRTLTLTCTYPHYIWTVLSFTAAVHDWSLSDKAILLDKFGRPGARRDHIIRHAGGHGTTSWNLTLTVKGRDKLRILVSALERDGFHEMVDEFAGGIGPARAARSWKWSDGWGSGEVLSRVERVMPEWVSGMFVGVVVSELDV